MSDATRGATSGPRTKAVTGYLLAALAAACWAAGGLMAKWLFVDPAADVRPVHLAAARAVIAFGLLLGYLALRRRRDLRVGLRDLPFLAGFGVIGLAAVHFTYFSAIELTNVPTAILLEYLAPVLVLVVSVGFLGERFTWALPAGVATSVAGCALMVGAVGGDGLRVSPSGIAWGLASAVFFAAYTVMGKYAAGRFSPWTLLVYGLGFASVFWLLFVGARGELGEVAALVSSPGRLGVVVAISVIATIVPFGAFLTALHHIDATKASITATLEPVIAGVVTYLIPALHARLTGLQLAGGALVLLACAMAQLPAARREVLPPPA